MRKVSMIMAGVALGAGAATVTLKTNIVSSSPASAAASDTYRDLNLFGDVFEKIRTDYVEKPDESKLVEAAINGMLTSLDPPFELYGRQGLSRHAGADAWRVRRPRHRGDAGRQQHQGGDADRRYPGLQGRHPVGRPDHGHRWRECLRPDPQPGGRQDARLGRHPGDAEDRARHQQGRPGFQAHARRDPDQICEVRGQG